jgi:hypothetical protein
MLLSPWLRNWNRTDPVNAAIYWYASASRLGAYSGIHRICSNLHKLTEHLMLKENNGVVRPWRRKHSLMPETGGALRACRYRRWRQDLNFRQAAGVLSVSGDRCICLAANCGLT